MNMFENTTVSHSTAHYLLAIAELHKERGYARAVDVAERFDAIVAGVSLHPNEAPELAAQGRLEEMVEGTLHDWMGQMGAVTLAFEGGQHQETAAVDRARRP